MNSSYCPICGQFPNTAGQCGCQRQPVTVTYGPPQPIPTGWKCPECGRINSPYIYTCPCFSYLTWIGTRVDEGNICQSGSVECGELKDVYIGDPPGSCDSDSVSSNADDMLHLHLS